MNYLKETLKRKEISAIFESIIFAILGIILVCKPEYALKIMAYVLGITFIIIGICKIITYCGRNQNNNFFNFDLIHGLTAIIIGIISMSYINLIGSIFRIIIGFWILYTSFISINTSIQIRKMSESTWIWTLILAVIMFLCGLYTIITPGTIIMTIGSIMVIYSILNIIESFIFMKNINQIL